jgi:serine acetyltransferase
MSGWFWVFVGVVAVGVILRRLFAAEIKACFERDPAARNVVEVLLCYSGLHAIMAHRLAHRLYGWGVPVVPRLIMAAARWATGIEIHPAARIGPGLFIDHGMGVVIGETAVIGDVDAFIDYVESGQALRDWHERIAVAMRELEELF